MRKRLILALLVILMITLSSPIYAATPKAGASCTKAGSTAISAGKKYTCIKSGKKLVWDKGVVIAKPVPTPTPTASPTPTPTPTPTPIMPISLDNLDINRVSQLAYEAVLKAYDSKIKKTAPIVFYIDPSISSTYISDERNRLNRIYTLLQNDFAPQSIDVLYWIDSSDSTILWAQNQFNSWYPTPRVFKKENPNSLCGNGFALNWPATVNNLSVERFGYVSCSGDVTPDKAFKAIHEYFHLFQYNYRFLGKGGVLWLAEGSADFYGQMLGLNYENPSSLVKHRAMMAKGFMESKHLTQEQFIALMQKMESYDGDGRPAYYLGSLATEVLVGLYGNEQFFNFVKDWKDLPDCRMQCVTTPNNFATRFEKYFGVTPLKFYEKLYPYYVGMNDYYLKN